MLQLQTCFHAIFGDADTLFPDASGKKASFADSDFVLSLLHLSFALLTDAHAALRESAMLLYRELLIRRATALRPAFLIDLPASRADAGGSGEFKADLYSACFEKLVTADRDVKKREPAAHAIAFDNFQKHFATLSPQFRG
jgi:hypothetical protein